MEKSILERFNEKYIKTEGCWEWQSYKNACGYGTFRVFSKMLLAHRIAYSIYIGPIPIDQSGYGTKLVLHKCDNTSCVNPDHLYLGEQIDNIRDRTKRGRRHCLNTRGIKNGSANLSEPQVLAIREDKRTQRIIAQEYGVSVSQISAIKTREKWKHI